MQFTLFVILPSTNDVCTLRHVQHGATIREIRSRLELEAGIPAQIYRLHNSDGQYMHEEHCLLLDQNVWDGFILRTQLFDSWIDLYDNIINDRVDKVIKNGAVRAGDNMTSDKSECHKLQSIISERGSVALYIAAHRGLFEMCSSLLQIGISPNGRTPFGRSPIYAATCRDNDVILDLLVNSAGDLDIKDTRGETPFLLSRRLGAKLCFRKIRLYNLNKNGLRPINGMVRNIAVNIPTNRKLKVNSEQDQNPLTHVPRPPTSNRNKTEKNVKQICAKTVSNSGDVTEHIPERPTSQCFVWDIDDKSRRLPEYHLQSVLDTKKSNSAKTAVRWIDQTGLLEIDTLQQQRGKFAAYPTTILKNRSYSQNNEKRSNLIRSLSRESLESNTSTVKSENAPSQADSELTLVSAPGDVSRLITSDCRSVESAPATSGVNHSKKSSKKGSKQRDSVRLLPFRRKENERISSAKRHIRLAETQKLQEKRFQNAETFDQWLDRKRLHECRERLTSQSDDSSHDSDSDSVRSITYDDWMKTRGRRKLNATHKMTVDELYRWKDRPLRGIVMVGNVQIADTERPPEQPVNDKHAYQRWLQKRPEHKQSNIDPEKLKARVERKRQQLLAAAITYDDWMEHAEEKKLLMQQILKADMKELERLEEDNLKKRTPRQMSFDKWNSSVLKKDFMDKKRREEERQTAEHIKAEQIRSSTCVTHEIWLEKKRQALKPKPKVVENSPRTQDEKDAAFAAWVRRKQQQEMAEPEDADKGRELLKVLRNKRQELSVQSY